MRQNDDLSRDNVIAKARALMIQIGSIDGPSAYQQSYEKQSNGDFDR